MAVENYDLRLLVYQTLLDLPVQVLAAETYEKLGKGRTSAYIAMSLLGIGATLASAKLGRGVYRVLHGENGLQAQPNTKYYVSPLTEYLVSHNAKVDSNALTKEKIQSLEKSLALLKDAPAYSSRYMQTAYSLGLAKVLFATLASPAQIDRSYMRLLYGVTQPLGVVLKDQGVL